MKLRRRVATASYAAALGLATYDLALLAAANLARRNAVSSVRGDVGRSDCIVPAGFTVVVVIPARNAGPHIRSAIESTQNAASAADFSVRVVVVGHNFTDDTEDQARACGAEVISIKDDGFGGKGRALETGLREVVSDPRPIDGILVMDADCKMSENCLDRVGRFVSDGASAVQVDNRVANPESSSSAALRFASFSVNTLVEPLGLFGLGGSACLTGTGMAFSSDLLRRVPFAAHGLTEDRDYYLALVREGERVHFADDAWVASDAPTTFRSCTDQQFRWESGNRMGARKDAWGLVATGIGKRNTRMLLAGANALMPGLIPSGAVTCVAGLGLAGTRTRNARVVVISAIPAVIFGTFVLGTLRFAGAPLAVYRALVFAPVAAVGKLWISGRLLLGWRRPQW